MASTRLCLLVVGCSMFCVCTLNLILVFRHLAHATLSVSNENDEYNLSIRWKSIDGNDGSMNGNEWLSNVEEMVASAIAGPSGDWKLRSPNRQSDPNSKKKNGDMGKMKDKENEKHRDNNTNKSKNKENEKTEDKSKNNDKTKNKHKNKNTDNEKDKDKDKNKDKNKNKNKEKNEGKKNKEDNIGSDNSTAFSRHEHVAIATKIHGEHQWALLAQSMCLLHYAYNHKVLYDIIVFSTESIAEEKIKSIQDMLSPVKFRVVVDNKGLQEEFADLSPAMKDAFLKMCNTTEPSDLDWWSECEGNRLAYNWQAEFRSIRLWHHPAMAEYKTMMWLDTDGFATKPWEKDPIDYFRKNEGVIMFDHFPQAKSKYWIQKRIFEAFNATICKLKLSEETGNLVTELGTGDRCQERGVPNIHGFFHITDLDFFRSKVVTEGLATIHGDCFLCRFPDDQLAVTAPAAVLEPDRSWEMRGKGFRLDVFHNYMLDGIDQAKPAGFKKYWNEVAKHQFPTAAGACQVTEAG